MITTSNSTHSGALECDRTAGSMGSRPPDTPIPNAHPTSDHRPAAAVLIDPDQFIESRTASGYRLNVREAVVAVLRDGDQVLVIQRGPQVMLPGYWTPISGRIEPGESQEAAVVREVREEVGLRVTPSAKVWECPTDDGDYVLHWWTADVEAAHLILDPREVSDARWVTAGEFLQMTPTFDGDREFFERVLPEL